MNASIIGKGPPERLKMRWIDQISTASSELDTEKCWGGQWSTWSLKPTEKKVL